MDDLLQEFLTETNESLDSLDVEVVRLEQEPNDPELLSSIFRLVHTIKGTCGFLGLPRLESVAHAGENVLGKFRDGELPVTPEAVTLILESLDCIKSLLSALERTEAEPEGDDNELIVRLNAMANGAPAPAPAAEEATAVATGEPEAAAAEPEAPVAEVAEPEPAEAEVPLIERVGGISAVDAAVEIMYRKILKDASLAPFFEGVDMTILQGRQVEFFCAALGGPNNYSGGDLTAMHKDAVDHGLNDSHFDAVGKYLFEALSELEVAEDVITDVLAIVETTREPILNKTEEAARPETKSPEKAAAGDQASDRRKDGKESGVAQTVRVSVDMLENLMTMVSELVLSRNQLLQMVRKFDDSEFAAPLQRLSLITTDLQEGVMKTRMQPIGNAWSKLPRIVRDLSHDLGKKIELEMRGAETELDRQVLEMIKDPLTHMVRNSGDHGIESPARRREAGKSETGKIVLNAYHEGGHIIIEISDDGAGINIDRVREKALANGLATEADLAEMSDKQIIQFIFKAGFSTAEKVTNVSGRGVGMDVVRTNIEKIGGHVELKSDPGRGSTFVVKIPLTLAIVSALIVKCAGERFAIPQISVDELVRVSRDSEHRIETINDTPVLRLRDRLLPLVALDETLGLRPAAAVAAQEGEDGPAAEEDSQRETFIVVARSGTTNLGIIVDQVFESEEIVVKPVTPVLREISIFSGNTILGDGSVIMILDPNGIASTIGEAIVNDTTQAKHSAERAHDMAAAERTTLLVFRAGSGEPKAVPLALVARLEEIEPGQMEEADGMPMVQYRGQLMPLLSLGGNFQRKTEGRQQVVVFTEGEHSMGLMVDEILDIVEDRLDLEIASTHEGLLGTAVIGGKATEVIDIAHYVGSAFGDWFKAKKRNGEGAAAKGKRILLVDDSPFFRNLLTPLLNVAGYNVTAVDGPERALSLREEGYDFDVIVSDIEMPGMNGFEFANAVKGGGSWSEIPLLALSAHADRENLERGREAGFTDYIAKLDRDALLESLSETLNNLRGAA